MLENEAKLFTTDMNIFRHCDKCEHMTEPYINGERIYCLDCGAFYNTKADVLKDLVEKQIKIEDDFMHATGELKGLYSASIRRGILEKLWSDAGLHNE